MGFECVALQIVCAIIASYQFVAPQLCIAFCSRMLRFAECCQRAWDGALKLVAWTAGQTEEAVGKAYRKLCTDNPSKPFGDQEHELDQMEVEIPDMCLDENGEPKDPAVELLAGIQSETTFVDPELQQPATNPEDTSDLDKMPDGDNIKQMLAQQEEGNDDNDLDGQVFLPSTLLEAMKASGDRWNALWRFVLKLRSSPGGCDVRWVPNPRGMRRTSAGLNWHQ